MLMMINFLEVNLLVGYDIWGIFLFYIFVLVRIRFVRDNRKFLNNSGLINIKVCFFFILSVRGW